MAMAYYTGWLLPEAERAALLARFPPVYERVIAHHATDRFGVGPEEPSPRETSGTVIGVADDGAGVQALVVAIGGSPSRRDGSTYHITWSLGPDRRAVESNHVIARLGWMAVTPVSVRLEPRFFPL